MKKVTLTLSLNDAEIEKVSKDLLEMLIHTGLYDLYKFNKIVFKYGDKILCPIKVGFLFRFFPLYKDFIVNKTAKELFQIIQENRDANC